MANYVNLSRRILNLLREELSYKFAAYFDGEPVLVGVSQLPALIVDWDSAAGQPAATRHDRWQHTIIVKVLMNKMGDIGSVEAGGTKAIIEVNTKKQLEDIIFGRDATSLDYRNDTVMGVLRRNFTMTGAELDQVVNIQFGNSQRPSGADTVVTTEAWVTILASEQFAVANRT